MSLSDRVDFEVVRRVNHVAVPNQLPIVEKLGMVTFHNHLGFGPDRAMSVNRGAQQGHFLALGRVGAVLELFYPWVCGVFQAP